MRQRGPAGLETVLTAVRPLIDVLWERELVAGPVDTPERRAVFEQRLEQLVRRIGDVKVQGLYRQSIRDRLWRTWRKPGRPASAGTRARTVQDTSAGEILLLAVLAHPWLLDEFTDEIAQFQLANDAHARALSYILRLHAEKPEIDGDSLDAALRASAFAPLHEHLTKSSGHKGVAFVNGAADPSLVRRQFAAFLGGTHRSALMLEEERLKKLLEQEPTEELLQELAALRKERDSHLAQNQSLSDQNEGNERSLDRVLADIAGGSRRKAS